jgi:cytochrome c-type biogenesis protein
MLIDILTWINNSLSANIYLSVFASFIWGGLSILLSPCHLASIPLLIGYISMSGSIETRKSFYISTLFAAGILISIALIGFITALMGRLLGDIGETSNYLIIFIFIIFGLYFLNILKLDWLQFKLNITSKKNITYAFLIGLITGISLGPCTFAFLAPILSIIFGVSASNVSKGIILLSAFALGHCILIVAVGMLSAKIQIYLKWAQSNRAVAYIRGGCGAVMILFAVYFFFTNYL